jgi:hypothetical protein
MVQITDPRAVDYKVGASAPQGDIPLWLRPVTDWWNQTFNRQPDNIAQATEDAKRKAALYQQQQEFLARQKGLQQYAENLQQSFNPTRIGEAIGQIPGYLQGLGQPDVPLWLRSTPLGTGASAINTGMKIAGDIGTAITGGFAETPYFGASNVKPWNQSLQEWEKGKPLAELPVPNPWNNMQNVQVPREAAGFMTPDMFIGAGFGVIGKGEKAAMTASKVASRLSKIENPVFEVVKLLEEGVPRNTIYEALTTKAKGARTFATDVAQDLLRTAEDHIAQVMGKVPVAGATPKAATDIAPAVPKAAEAAAAVPPAPPKLPPPVNPALAGKGDELNRMYAMLDVSRNAPQKSADRFLKFMEQFNDVNYGLRRNQTQAAKTTFIALGTEKDTITLITRTPGAANAGATRYILAIDEIKKVSPDIVPNDINAIINANHYKEILAEKGPERVMAGGFNTAQELDQVLAQLQAKLGPEAFNQAQKGAAVVQRIYQQELQRLVKAGLINEQLGKVLAEKYPWYNPLQYVDDAEKIIATGKSAKPYTVISSGLKRLTETGTAKTARAPLDVMADQLIKNEVRIHNNEVAKSIIAVALDDPKLGITKIPNPSLAEDTANTLSFFVNGERHTYRVPDFIYREADTLTKISAHPIPSLIGAINGVSRAAFTSASPAFVVSNMLNDSLAAFIRGGVLPTETAGRLIASLRGLENDKIMQSFRLAGGYQQRFYGKDLAAEIIKSGGQTIHNSESFLKKAWKFIPEAGEAGEQAPRMAYFQKQLNKTLPGWKKMTPEQIAATPQGRAAAAGAVELTINFGRGGYLVKAANPFIIFLNANMEGMKLPLRALREVPAAKWRLAGMGAGVTALAGYNLSYPEYFDIPDNIRWGSVVVMLPPKEKDPYTGKNKPNYLTVIPRTREWGAFLGSATYAMEKMFSDSPTDFGRYIAVQTPMLMPFAEIPMPAVISELTEQVANYDFYRSQPIVPAEMQGLPNEQQVQPWVSPTIAAVANAFGQSPLRAQHFFTGIFGGAGSAATSVTDYIAGMIAPPKTDPRIVNLAEQYKALANQTERNKFMMNLSQDDKDAMLAQMRQPQKGIPVISSVVKRVYPEQSGQLYKTGQLLAEQQTGISPQQTKEVSTVLGKVSDMYLKRQRELDNSFTAKQINGADWKAARAELGQNYQGALDVLGVQFPTAAQVQQDPTVASKYYQTISTLAGTMPDVRDRAQVLAAGWYAIDLQETVPGSKDWTTFFNMRDQYKASLAPEDRQLLDDYLQSKMTPTEKLYARVQEIVKPYWGVTDKYYGQYPPEVQATADMITQLETSPDLADKMQAKVLMAQYPQILFIRKQIALEKKMMKMSNPAVAAALSMFYSY